MTPEVIKILNQIVLDHGETKVIFFYHKKGKIIIDEDEKVSGVGTSTDIRGVDEEEKRTRKTNIFKTPLITSI